MVVEWCGEETEQSRGRRGFFMKQHRMVGVHGAATMRMRGAGLEKAWHVSAEPRARSFAGATSLNWPVGPTRAEQGVKLATVAPARDGEVSLSAPFTIVV